MNEPNLFNFATKELSQDAFFCWLFSWAEEKYSKTKLYIIAKDFLYDIMNEKVKINKIDIIQQYKKIDFYIRINENITIAFEDKVKTSEHDNQLEHYRDIVMDEFPDDRLYFVYLKTNIIFQDEKEIIEKSGYKIYDIFAIYSKLKKKVENNIYEDFLRHLTKKIKSYENFDKIQYSKWGQNEWNGLCFKLKNEIKKSFEFGIWQGRELYWEIATYKCLPKREIWSSLMIKHSKNNNDGGLCIFLFFYDNRLNKHSIRDELKNKYIKMFKNEKIEFGNKIGKKTNLLKFNDFPVIKNGYIDFNKTKEYLNKIIKMFNEV